MKINMKEITQSDVINALIYDKDSGLFYWRNASGKHKEIPPNTLAGGKGFKGYWVIKLFGNVCKAHRLAWLYVYGKWPQNMIDHKDRNKLNNAIDNLREASPRENAVNSKIFITNKSGYRSVYWEKDRRMWGVSMRNNENKHIRIGRYKNLQEAVLASCEARNRLYGEFNPTN